MDMQVYGSLPGGEGNGLAAIASQLVREEEGGVFAAVCLIDCRRVTFDRDTGAKIPQVRIRRVEVVLDPEDQKVLRRLMERSLNRRAGRESVPYDLEAELDQVFGDRDLEDFREPGDPPGGTGG